MDIVARATFMYFALFLLLRLLGKRELGQMTPFEIVLLVALGDLVQQGVTHNDFSLTGATLAIVTFAFWGVAIGWLVYLFPRLKAPVEGLPTVIVCDGKIVEGNLRRDRMTRAEVESEMRLAGIGRIDQVAWAIVETQGRISFIKKDEGEVQRRDAEDSAAH